VSFTSAWRWALPGAGNGRGIAGIAQDANQAYVAVYSDTRGSLYAVSLRTGRAVWALALGGSATAAPVVVGGHVLVDSQTSAGDDLVAVTATNGRVAWRHHDIESGDLTGPFAVRIGDAAFVSDHVGKKSYVTRLNPATGKVTARHATTGGVVTAAGARVLTDDGTHLTAYPVSLARPAWTATSAGSLAQDVYTDSTIASIAQGTHTAAVVGYDPTSGRRLWHRTVAGATKASFSAAGSDLLLTDVYCSSSCSMTAITARTGAIRWKSLDSDNTANYAGPDVAAGGLLLCGTNLLSVDATSGALYKTVEIPNRSQCSAPLLRTDDQAGTTSPHHVLAAALDELRSYRTTTADNPPVRTDQNGGWGKVDPKQCGVDPAATAAGLKADLGGTWVLTSADELGVCFWSIGRSGHGLQVSTRPVGTAAAAKTYLNPRNMFGGCVTSGYFTRGHSGTLPATGLPAGSGLCYFTRYYFLGDKSPDRISGVTRTHAGHYVAIDVNGLPWGTVTTPAVLTHVRDLLARLAT
jgi:PQQ-like domain